MITRKKSRPRSVKAKVGFISYSHKDMRRCDELREHLAQLHREQLIAVWHDGLIDQKTPWDKDIKAHLQSAHVVLLLVSARFLASHYIWEVEIKSAMRRYRKGEAIIIPIIIGKCDWETACFSRLNAVPAHGRPISGSRDRRDCGWTEVAKKVRSVLAHL